MTSRNLLTLLTLAAALLCACMPRAWSGEGKPIRIGIVTYLSGPGAGPMGLPARNAAELTFDALNAGACRPPIRRKDSAAIPSRWC
jgi:branched-chain amino acid transport system substrate-binding protein